MHVLRGPPERGPAATLVRGTSHRHQPAGNHRGIGATDTTVVIGATGPGSVGVAAIACRRTAAMPPQPQIGIRKKAGAASQGSQTGA